MFARFAALAVLSLGALGAECGAGSESACPATGPCEPEGRLEAEIRGVVLDAEGDPVAGAIVESEPPTESHRTASDGRFSIGVPAPTEGYTMTVVARHEALGQGRVEVAVTTENPTPEVEIRLTPPDPPDDPSGEPGGPDGPDTDLRVTVPGQAVFPCLFEGDPLRFDVEVRNVTDSAVVGVTVHDSLDSAGSLARWRRRTSSSTATGSRTRG